jgi:hypothetical protein
MLALQGDADAGGAGRSGRATSAGIELMVGGREPMERRCRWAINATGLQAASEDHTVDPTRTDSFMLQFATIGRPCRKSRCNPGYYGIRPKIVRRDLPVRSMNSSEQPGSLRNDRRPQIKPVECGKIR